MTFEHDGCVFNLVDTPGHQDFSEDTYRSLTAVDSAIMVLDAAKGRGEDETAGAENEAAEQAEKEEKEEAGAAA